MKKCFGYVRVSTVKQGEGVSLMAQKEAILHYTERNEIEIVKWFEEKVTAAKSGRPLFTQMLRELKNGKAQGLVVHKIDRSARNFADWAKIGDLSDAGIDVHFASESLDFRSRGGRLTADIQAVIASDYIRNLKEETRKGIRGRLKQGLYPFAAPLGYLDMGRGNAKEVDIERAPLVKKMFELYATGEYPIRRLVNEMDIRGLRTKAGGRLSKTGIENILGNSFYIGVVKIKKTGETFKGLHKPIVSGRLFEDVQAVKLGKSRKILTRHNRLFRGLFRCALCKNAMTPELQKNHIYYRCHTKMCETKTVREEELELATVTALAQLRFDDKQINQISVEVNGWENQFQSRTETMNITVQITKQNTRLENLTEKLIDGIIDNSTFQKTKEKLMHEIVLLEQKRDEIKELTINAEKLKLFLERAKNLCFQYIYSNADEKRRLLNLLTSNRLVSGKKIEIELQNWLHHLTNCVSSNCGYPFLATNRTNHSIENSEHFYIPELMKKINEFLEPE